MNKNAYVISLNNPVNLLNQISTFDLNPILVEGVNGKDLSSQTIRENTTFMCSMFCTKSMIGIAMAHMKAWELIVESKDDYGIVFEDDVIFTKNFKKDINIGLKNVPSDFDILYLGCIGCDSIPNFFTILGVSTNIINLNHTKINKYINKPMITFALHAYVLSRTGAKKLLNFFEHKINNHIDYSIQELLNQNLINNSYLLFEELQKLSTKFLFRHTKLFK